MTTMNDLALRIVTAIFKQEAMPDSYTNPGNLRDCPWFPFKSIDGKFQRAYPDGTAVNFITQEGTGEKFWAPRTRAEGIVGAHHVVALHIAEGNTLRQLIGGWAPAADGNNTETYIKNVKEWAGVVNEDTPLWSYCEVAV